MPFNPAAAAMSASEPDILFGWERFADAGGDGRRVLFLPPSHSLRSQAESCIRDVYARVYRARNLTLPSALIALLDENDRLLCAAGLRTAADGFFSEIYLDAPIDRLLAERSGRAVAREAVFEVTTLVSLSVEASPVFVREIAVFGRRAGFRWSFFTATARLQKLLRQLGMPIVDLSPADPGRVTGAEHWGSYYAHSPRVCAVDDQWLDHGPPQQRRRSANA